MAERVELEKNVPNTRLQDIQWALNCTDAWVKAVADTVKSLLFRMDSLEEGMSVVKNHLTEEMSSLKEFVRNKEKIEENAKIPNKVFYHPGMGEPNLKNKDECFLLRE